MLLVSITTCSAIVLNNSFSSTLIGCAVLCGGINLSCWLGYSNYVLDIAPDRDRIQMFIVQSIMMLPISVIGYFIGSLADQVGYLAIFTAITVLSVIVLRCAYVCYGLKKRRPSV